MKKLIIFVLVFLSTAGCASSPIIHKTAMVPEAQATNSIDLIYDWGDPIALLEDSRAKVATTLMLIDGSDILELHVFFKNLSKEKIEINPLLISVHGVPMKGENIVLKIFPPQEVLESFENRYRKAVTFYAIGDTLQNMEAGHSETQTYGSGSGYSGESIHGTGSYASYSGHSNASYSEASSTYDPAKAALVQKANAQEAKQIRQGFKNSYVTLERQLLERHTLFSGQQVEGIVQIQFVQAKKYIVSIPFGKNEYIFEFNSPIYENYYKKMVPQYERQGKRIRKPNSKKKGKRIKINRTTRADDKLDGGQKENSRGRQR